MPVGTNSVTWGYSRLCGNAVISFPREKWTGNLVVDRTSIYFHYAERLAGMFHCPLGSKSSSRTYSEHSKKTSAVHFSFGDLNDI